MVTTPSLEVHELMVESKLIKAQLGRAILIVPPKVLIVIIVAWLLL